jgi:hypothetical protein
MFPHYENIWPFLEHGNSCRMCTPHCLEAGVGAPRNRCLCQAIVSMIFSFLIELTNCHAKTHGVTDCSVLSCVFIHMSFHNEIKE